MNVGAFLNFIVFHIYKLEYYFTIIGELKMSCCCQLVDGAFILRIKAFILVC